MAKGNVARVALAGVVVFALATSVVILRGPGLAADACERWAAENALVEPHYQRFQKRENCRARTAEGEYRVTTAHGPLWLAAVGWLGAACVIGCAIAAGVARGVHHREPDGTREGPAPPAEPS